MQNSNSLFNTNDGPAPTQEQFQEDQSLPFQGGQASGGGGGGLPAGIPPGLIPPGMEGMAAQAM